MVEIHHFLVNPLVVLVVVEFSYQQHLEILTVLLDSLDLDQVDSGLLVEEAVPALIQVLLVVVVLLQIQLLHGQVVDMVDQVLHKFPLHLQKQIVDLVVVAEHRRDQQ